MRSYPHLWSELRIGTCAVRNRRVAWGPSAVKSYLHGTTPKAMEPEDLAEAADA